MKNNNAIKKISILTLAAIIGSIVVVNQSSAKWVRYNASICEYDEHGGGYPTLLYNNNRGAWQNTDDSSDQYFNCPVPNTDYLRQDEITHVRVHVYDGHDSDSVWAKACAQDYDGVTGWCGNSDSSGSSNVKWDVLKPEVSELSYNYTDFGYILIKLPDEDDGTSKLTGIYFYN